MPDENELDERATDETGIPPLPEAEEEDVLGPAIVPGAGDAAVEDDLAAEDDEFKEEMKDEDEEEEDEVAA